jgi:hypothetical protein
MPRDDGEPPPYRRYKRVPTVGVEVLGWTMLQMLAVATA